MNNGRATSSTDELESLRREVRALAAIVAAQNPNAGIVSPGRKRPLHHEQRDCTCAARNEVAATMCRAPASSIRSGPRAGNVVTDQENRSSPGQRPRYDEDKLGSSHKHGSSHNGVTHSSGGDGEQGSETNDHSERSDFTSTTSSSTNLTYAATPLEQGKTDTLSSTAASVSKGVANDSPGEKGVDGLAQEDPHPHRRFFIGRTMAVEVRDGVDHSAGSNARSDDSRNVEDMLSSYIPDSVYLWACGVKTPESDEDVAATDVVSGWLILLAQMLVYAMLIWTADDPEETEYSIFAVALAMYLMVSIAAPDVRAGYTLLFWGKSIAHRIFGATLLCSFFLLTVASMKVMFADATDNAELVVDAAVILFVTEMDEKMMHFLRTTKQRWRLFWTLETMGISLWLAIVGVLYVGNPESVTPSFLDDGGTTVSLPYLFPPYFVFAFTPGTVTILAFVLNALVWKPRSIGDPPVLVAVNSSDNAGDGGDRGGTTSRYGISHLVGVFIRRPVFGAALAVWHFCSILLGFSLTSNVVKNEDSNDDYEEDILLISSAAITLACFSIGLVSLVIAKIFSVGLDRRRTRWCVLFVGWGIGAGVGFALIQTTAYSKYFVLPVALVSFGLGAYSFADSDTLGPWVGERIRPTVAFLQNRDHISHWAIMSCMQLLMVSWVTRMYLYIRFHIIK